MARAAASFVERAGVVPGGAPQEVRAWNSSELLERPSGAHLDDPLEVVAEDCTNELRRNQVLSRRKAEDDEEAVAKVMRPATGCRGGDREMDEVATRSTQMMVIWSRAHSVSELSLLSPLIVDAEAQRRAHTEGGARDGQRVNGSPRGVHEVTEQRVKRASHRQGHVPAVAHQTERDGNDDVGAPAVEAPVEEGGEDGHLRAVVVVEDGDFPEQSAAVVGDGLGDAPVVDADADAAGEEHGEP